MAAVDIFNVRVLDNPAPFTNPLQFEITYDVREVLKEDIEWQVVYVGSAEDQSRDQQLDAVLLPASTNGRFKFVLQVPSPDASRIPPADILGVTIVLLTCSYKNKEFIRVGYYVNNEHPDYPQSTDEQQPEDLELTVADDGVADDDAGAEDDGAGEDDADEDMDTENALTEAAGSSTDPASASAATPAPAPAKPKAPAAPSAPLPSVRMVPTKMPDIERITRIISNEPTVTRFPLKQWDEPAGGTLLDPELSTDAMVDEAAGSNDIPV